MAFTQTQLDAVEAAIASGELRVMFDGREVVYRSVPELIDARNLIRASLEASGATAAKTRTSYVSRGRN